MAPEAIRMQEPPTPKSDIWSVGCLTLELLTGKPPYFNLTPLCALYHICEDAEIPLEDPQHVLTPDCLAFLRECFRKNPAQRKSAAQLLALPWFAALYGQRRNRIEVGGARSPAGRRESERSWSLSKESEGILNELDLSDMEEDFSTATKGSVAATGRRSARRESAKLKPANAAAAMSLSAKAALSGSSKATANPKAMTVGTTLNVGAKTMNLNSNLSSTTYKNANYSPSKPPLNSNFSPSKPSLSSNFSPSMTPLNSNFSPSVAPLNSNFSPSVAPLNSNPSSSVAPARREEGELAANVVESKIMLNLGIVEALTKQESDRSAESAAHALEELLRCCAQPASAKVLVKESGLYPLLTLIRMNLQNEKVCLLGMKVGLRSGAEAQIIRAVATADPETCISLIMMGMLAIITHIITDEINASAKPKPASAAAFGAASSAGSSVASGAAKSDERKQIVDIAVELLQLFSSGQGEVLDIFFASGLINSAAMLLGLNNL